MKRVVVNGMAGITALGHDWPTMEARLRARRNAVRPMPEWGYFDLDPTFARMPMMLQTRSAKLDGILSRNFGFGGNRAALMFRRYAAVRS